MRADHRSLEPGHRGGRKLGIEQDNQMSETAGRGTNARNLRGGGGPCTEILDTKNFWKTKASGDLQR